MLIGQDHFFQKRGMFPTSREIRWEATIICKILFLKVRDENTAEPLKQQPHKMVDATADELFECVWAFCGISA